MSDKRATSSPRMVIPPIITSEKERDFLIKLNSYIDEELSAIDRKDPDKRYTVYQGAFDQIVENVGAYKPLLSTIKAEYETCISSLQQEQREAVYLSGKLKVMINEPSTLRNYKKRADELENKIALLKANNECLLKQLLANKKLREDEEKKTKEAASAESLSPRKDSRLIPGLTMEQCTNKKFLENHLNKLDVQLREMTWNQKMRYVPKKFRDQLKEKLSEKCVLRDQLIDEMEMLKIKKQNLRVAVDAAETYIKLQPMHETIGDVIIKAFDKPEEMRNLAEADDVFTRLPTPEILENDDPAKENESELVLEYIEKFSQLLEEQKYEEAAIHAANSHNEILRNMETMNKFKELKGKPTKSGRSPQLAFSDALMSTVLAYTARPNVQLSMECVMCALEENRLDLLSHWISQERLTMTEEIGDKIYEYSKGKPSVTLKNCLSLAQKVYAEVECKAKAVICLVKQGRVKQAVDYAQKLKLNQRDYREVIKACPLPELIHDLYHTHVRGRRLVPLGAVLSSLLETDFFAIGMSLLVEASSKKQESTRNPVQLAVSEDEFTSNAEWSEIAQRCQDYGYQDISVDILAAVTVQNVIRDAYDHITNAFDSKLNSLNRDELENKEKLKHRKISGKNSDYESDDNYGNSELVRDDTLDSST